MRVARAAATCCAELCCCRAALRCAQGEPSVFEREAAGQGLKERCGKSRNKLQIAGRDYGHQDYCQVGWLALVCC